MNKDETPLVVFAGGGTIGPVTPLLAVAAELRREHSDWRLMWIGTRTGPERELVEKANITFRAVASGKLRRYFSGRNFLAPFMVAAGLVQAWVLFGKVKPSAVVSAGGFVAAPVIWAAWLRRVPVHIHQQDIRPTLTNVITAPFAASASVAFEKSLADFHKLKPVLTGNPVRPAVLSGSRDKAREIFGLEQGVPTVLAVGGGTGAAGLNILVTGSLPVLTEHCQVIHVTGRGKKTTAADSKRYHQHEMLVEEFPHALAAADLVVTRAGIGSLSELAALGKASVMVPMPRSHQVENARYFADRSAGLFLSEAETFSKQFGDLVVGLLSDSERTTGFSKEISKLNDPSAARRVAGLVAVLVENKDS